MPSISTETVGPQLVGGGTINCPMSIVPSLSCPSAIQLLILDNISVKIAGQKLENETSQLLTEFDDDEISKEIKGGVGAKNTSGTLGGYGNLFSFIGFNDGSNPIGLVLSYLKQKIRITKNINYQIISDKSIKVSVSAEIPSREELEGITQLPWGVGSWLFKMSTGISGLGYYISRMLAGRSLGGFQSHHKVRGAVFSKKTYFSAMYKKFVKKLSKNNNFK